MNILSNLSKIQLNYIKKHIVYAKDVKEGLLHKIPTLAIKLNNGCYVLVNYKDNSYVTRLYNPATKKTIYPLRNGGYSILNAISHITLTVK